MGIRIKKLIGYGITDLAYERVDKYHTEPCDPRWDYQKYVEDWRKGDRETSLEDFLAWCEKNKDFLIELLAPEYPGEDPRQSADFNFLWMIKWIRDNHEEGKLKHWYAPYSAFTYDDDAGLPDAMLFQPPECHDWTRYDNTIDYYENTDWDDDGTPQTYAKVLHRVAGIYPYNTGYIRYRDASPELNALLEEKLSHLTSDQGILQGKLVPSTYSMLVGNWSKDRDPMVKGELLEHLRNDWRPRIPDSIIALLAYMGCFPDLHSPDSMLNTLRPMLYTYWT